MNILYIGRVESTHSGASVVNQMHQRVLDDISNGNVDCIEPDYKSLSSKFNFGITGKFLNDLQELMSKKKYDYVFISISLLGRAVKFIKRNFPESKVITFFHNIERQYGIEYYRSSGFRALPFLLSSSLWELRAVRYSDYKIVLNERDAQLMKSYYKSTPDAISPVCVFDRFQEKYNQETKDIDYLFVGVAFFANIKSIQWFIDEVMPYVSGQLCIVGNGMEKVDFKNTNDRVKVYGFVPSLSEFYMRAKCVVSPILEGGGMKTKTAEALMYGKLIFGSPEAFEGYKVDDKCMKLCNSAQDYVEKLSQIESEPLSENAARELFLSEYSYQNKYQVFRSILNER